MKKLGVILSLGMIFLGLQLSNAQLLKKLKDKVNKKVDEVEQRIENKIENEVDEKIDKTLDGTIDGIFESNKNTPPYTESGESSKDFSTENKAYEGSVSLNHAQNYGTVQINSLDNLKIIRTDKGYTFSGNWFSHEVDVYDGYNLEITTDENLELGKTYTFNISNNANLRIGYDPELPAVKNQGTTDRARGISDHYQNLDLSSGLVKVTINEDKSFEIDFSGQAEFTQRTRTADDRVQESKYTASIMGNLQGSDPQFIDNRTITKTSDTSSHTASAPSSIASGKSAQAKEAYVFTYETVVEMTVPDQNRKSKLSYLLNPNASYMGMKADMGEYSGGDVGGESLIVIDGDQSFVFVNTSGMKIQMSSAQMGNKQQMPGDQMENYDYSNLNKTGNTKTILGYTCHEYVMSDNQNSIQMWVAPDLVVPNWFMQNQDVIQGHILEYSVDSPEGQMTLTTSEIKDDINKTINPSEYRKMF